MPRSRKPKEKLSIADERATESLEELKAIAQRLSGLIYLVAQRLAPKNEQEGEAEGGVKRGAKKKQKLPARQEQLVIDLAQAGLRPMDIAKMTGRHRNNVSRDISKARKLGWLPRS
jgi:DNA-directed RNA polymerase specialized sigma24 family protein